MCEGCRTVQDNYSTLLITRSRICNRTSPRIKQLLVQRAGRASSSPPMIRKSKLFCTARAQDSQKRSVVLLAHMMEASELISVNQVHFDGAYYVLASVTFAETSLERGAKFRVPSTVSSLNVDQKHGRASELLWSMKLNVAILLKSIWRWEARNCTRAPRTCWTQHRN